ncbi:MAG TPA: NAD(P)/FAD-dependent oxidoreductase [Candidatus Limnocylindria bacterium]|jgi:predicted Rossmann fold flavoprotein|nr:NAD(P)/FAD-dependent oxidoreductase [Candidatus Limnocylindria bacterium]
MRKFDALVLGGGAAGLLCAIEAGKRGRRVAVLEHADRIGKKILISGGGRCNFTNIHCQPDNFISANEHFAKSALARYTPADFIALVEKHGIPYHEKTLGQLFCDRSAHDITELLESECQAAGVQTFLQSRIREVQRTTEFVVRAESAEFQALALVVATGGLSIPKMGATPFGYKLARQFGLKIVETKPALVPFVLAGKDHSRYCDLAGVSAEVVAKANHHAFREKMLITHRGLSGPAILQISSYWEKGQSIHIDLAPDREVTEAIRASKVRNMAAARTAFQGVLPKRLAERWLENHAPPAWNNDALAKLEKHAHAWVIKPADTEGYEKAEVTAGGVDTDELSSKTMECLNVKGLFFIGEVVDVTGHLGGFNFQWAWASGAAAGRAI